MENPSPTPAYVAQNATQVQALPLEGITLCGTVTGPAGTRAILRTPDGRLQTVQVGDATAAGQVLAIGESTITLNINGTASPLGIAGH